MRNDALRNVIERERRLRKIKAHTAMIENHGRTATKHSTGSKIFTCSNCGSPVVDSQQARLGHTQRKPECRLSMEVEE